MICRGGIHSSRKSTDPPDCPERKEAFHREGGHTMNNDLINRIKKHAPRFSKGQRAIANFLITNYEKAAFMTASKLGEVAGVSESTVVRFAVAIGFEGYPELQAALQELIRMRLTPVQRMEVTNDRIGNGDVLESVLNSDISKIRSTLETVSHADFDSAVEALMHARKIYIIGMRSSAILASFLAFNFRFMFEHVSLVQTTSGSEVFEQLLRVSEDDAVIAISFPRYSKRIINAVEFASSQHAKIIAITDSEASPIAPYAGSRLFAKSDMASFGDSLVAPLSIVDALIVAISRRKQRELERVFTRLENIWDEYEVYDKGRI